MSKLSIDELKAKAKELRTLIIDTTVWAGSGHYGGALSSADILTALYFRFLNIDPANPDWDDRDRFILSKGHSGIGFIPCLHLRGYFPVDELKNFNHFMSPFGMHPDCKKVKGCDASTGSLGHGLPMGVGMALGAKVLKKDFKTVVLLGDGECNEGSNYEAMMAASHYKLTNLIAIVDRNGFMIDGPTETVMGLEPFADKWEAFGWTVYECDGHNMQELCDTLDKAWANDTGKPVAIIAKTVKGKGVSFLEGDVRSHYGAFDSAQAEQAKQDIANM
ncbi:MAG: transketolase [Clostridiales bacterium]|jgi:transketolase|nr:transketolase [Clostridiales bacterium]HOB65005.1 transketolase [Clostridia bacterium]HOK81683.1 transketolase [Clostridia bacterium]HOL60580.1 transketolase [Clostridia bacterium]HPO52987.1 transketolase [Clostridia bacterium]